MGWGCALTFAALALPTAGMAQFSCAEKSVSASALTNRNDVRAFVQCAKEYAEANGPEEAYRAFHEDERWRSGTIYVFVARHVPGDRSLALAYPGGESFEGSLYEPLVDQFGSDYFAEELRLVKEFGGGWIYYSFLNLTTGRAEPKVSYVVPVDWGGSPAYLGAGIYQRGTPGTCAPEDVNAAGVEMTANAERLRDFVRCAAIRFDEAGYFATQELMSDPRWREGSIYVFGVDPSGAQIFTGNPIRKEGRAAAEWGDAQSPIEFFDGRDQLAAAATFGEMFLYYRAINPATGQDQRKVVFLKRTAPQGAAVLIGSGYYLPDD